MKLFPLLLGALLCLSCRQEPTYQADSNRPAVDNLAAVPGDEVVTLTWTMDESASPVDYLISYNDQNGETVSVRSGSTATSFTVEGLVNGVTYVFSVQAVYAGDKLSGIEKVSCVPATERIPASGLTLSAGDAKITVSWTAPASGNLTGYTITAKTDGENDKTFNVAADAVTFDVEGLTNFKEYEVSIVATYAKGPSEAVSGKAMPMSGAPLCSVLYDKVYSGQEDTFSFNTTDYPGATDITWTFEDGTVLSGAEVKYKIFGKDEALVIVKAKVAGNAVEYKLYLEVREYAISFDGWEDTGIKFKNTNFAFSPDRKTAYVLSYGSARWMIAFDLVSGALKWTFNLNGGQGNGADFAVNPVNGDVIISSDTVLYAIKEDGTLRWKVESFGITVGCGPAFSPDAQRIYVGTDSNDLRILSSADGSQLGSLSLGGKLGAIIVDNNKLFVALRAKVDPNIFFLDVSNPADIVTTKSFKFDSQATDICSASVAPDKKTAYFCGDKYIYCVDLSTMELKKSVQLATSKNVVCSSVVYPNGDVAVVHQDADAQSYMTLFSAGLEAQKWQWYPESHANTFNYGCPALDVDGNLYIAERTGKVWVVSPQGEGTLFFNAGQAYQSATGMVGNMVFFMGNAAPGLIVAKCAPSERAGGWSGFGGDPCCTKCIQWVYKD